MDQSTKKTDPKMDPDLIPEDQLPPDEGIPAPEPSHDRPWDAEHTDDGTVADAEPAGPDQDEEPSDADIQVPDPASDPGCDPAELQARITAQALALRAAEARLAEALKRQDDMVSAYRKMQSEFDASRQRLDRERTERLERERCSLLERLFDPLDNLERSIAAANGTACDPKLLEGLLLVLRQFQGALTELGLERIDPLGQPFSPEFHEALSVKPVVDPEEDNRVLEVWQVGYKVGSRLLRPARVLIGRK